MKTKIERYLIGLMFALLAAGVTLVIANARRKLRHNDNITYDKCANCHEDTQVTWQNGPHGHAMTDPVFLQD